MVSLNLNDVGGSQGCPQTTKRFQSRCSIVAGHRPRTEHEDGGVHEIIRSQIMDEKKILEEIADLKNQLKENKGIPRVKGIY